MNRLQGYVRNSRTWWATALVVLVAMAVFLTQEGDDLLTSSELVASTELTMSRANFGDERVWEDTAGRQHSLFGSVGSRYRVLTFVTTDCPIANACQPELSRLCEFYSEANVDFYQVNSTQTATFEVALFVDGVWRIVATVRF